MISEFVLNARSAGDDEIDAGMTRVLSSEPTLEAAAKKVTNGRKAIQIMGVSHRSQVRCAFLASPECRPSTRKPVTWRAVGSMIGEFVLNPRSECPDGG